MNYCYNCGTRILDENQNFCINCGAPLKERNDMGSQSPPFEIPDDIDIKDNPFLNGEDDFTSDDIDDLFFYLKGKVRINKGKKRRAKGISHSGISSSAYGKTFNPDNGESSYGDEDNQNSNPFHKEVVSEGMFGKPEVFIDGDYVRDGYGGKPIYHIDGDIIRDGYGGKPVYRRDGNFIREGYGGKPKYYIDGDLIREKNQFGRVVGRRR